MTQLSTIVRCYVAGFGSLADISATTSFIFAIHPDIRLSAGMFLIPRSPTFYSNAGLDIDRVVCYLCSAVSTDWPYGSPLSWSLLLPAATLVENMPTDALLLVAVYQALPPR